MKTQYLACKVGLAVIMASSLSACFDGSDDKPRVNKPPLAESINLVTQTEVAIMDNLTASDPEKDVLLFMLASEPSLGSATINTDGSFTYQPFNEQVGTDVFTYTVTDSAGNAAIGTVSSEIEMLQVSVRQFTRDVFAASATEQPTTLNGKTFNQDVVDQSDFQDLLDNN